MAETLTIRTASSTEVVKISSQGPQGPKGDKGDPGDVAGLPLSTLGDTLYRGASENQRLPIGTSGQILKVSAGGIPEWGAAPATGVTSVALASSDLTITGSPITSSGTITANVTVNGLTLNKLETIQSAHFLGRHGAGAGDVQPVSASQARTILNVADGAEANVQSNWTEADSGSDSFILNKPSTFAPSSHSSSHASAGSDPLAPSDIGLGATDDVTFNSATLNALLTPNGVSGIDVYFNGVARIVDESTTGSPFADFVANNNLSASRTYDLPDRSGELMIVGDAPASHTHGNITSDGKVGSDSGRVLVTTTAGAVTTLALGTAGQILRTKSDLSGVEFADPAASGVTGAASSASDVLGVSGANITGVDAGSDKIVFWDDSASELTYAATTGGTFDGTTLRWPVELVIACSDESTNLTTGTAKVTFRAPYAFTLTAVRASVNAAPTGSTLIVDINEGGTSVLSTKLSIDASEKTSTTAASAAAISDSAIADDSELTIDIDQIGSTIAGKGLKVVLIGTRA